jgi:hypothetical protein
MTASSNDPQPVGAPPRGNPLVVGVLALLMVGGFVGVIVWKRSTIVHGGPLALDARQDGEIDAVGTQSVRVPGRENFMGDVADVWTISLDANQTYTVQVCARSAAQNRRRYSPAFLIHGPGGVNDQRVEASSASPADGTPEHRMVTYTPSHGGTHSIWVYKRLNYNGGGYRVQVTRGARAEIDMSLCM